MDGTRELVDAGQVGTALLVLSVLALVAAVVLSVAGKARVPMKRAAILAGAAVLIYPLWLAYNAIEDLLGLDSVAALLINLVLFAIVGALVGLAIKRLWPADDTISSPRRHGARDGATE